MVKILYIECVLLMNDILELPCPETSTVACILFKEQKYICMHKSPKFYIADIWYHMIVLLMV